MVNYKCFRCGYECNQKGMLLNHLSRKKPCKAILNKVDNLEILKQNKIDEYNKIKFNIQNIYKNEEKYIQNIYKKSKKYTKNIQNNVCQYCGKVLSNYYSKWRHEKICKKRENKDESVFKTVNNTTNNTTNNTNTNTNCHNKTINIQVNNFDRENLEYISGRQALKVAKNFKGLISNFIDLVHFNKNHPENHTIRIKDIKSGLAEIREKNKWSYISMSDFLDEMRLSLYDKLETLKDNICEEDLDLYDNYLEKVDEILEDMKKVKVINKKIKVASINGSNKIHKKEDL